MITPNIDEIVHFERNSRFVFNKISESDGHYNISVSAFGLPPIDFCVAMLHEMTHHFCYINNIQDTSRGNMYHNEKFKEEAEKHGLIAVKDPKYYYSITIASDELAQWCNKEMPQRAVDILYYKCQKPKVISKYNEKSSVGNPNSHSRKYICPICGDSFRSTKDVYMICGKCNTEMIKCDGKYNHNLNSITGDLITAQA